MNICWDWEPSAMRGEPAPDGLGLIDKLAYLSMKGVYAQYQAGRLTKEEAQREKAEIKALCGESMETVERQQTILQAVDAMLTDTADLRRKIRKVKTAEEVARLGLDLCAVLDGRMTVTGQEAISKAFTLCGIDEPIPRQWIAP